MIPKLTILSYLKYLRLLETELIRVICSVIAFTQDSCPARAAMPGSTKKGCALFLISSKLF